jgi:hypothetical protein
MKRRVTLITASALIALATLVSSDRAGAKNANIFQLLTGFSSKETCSCAFVVDQSDDYCKAFGQSAGYDVVIVIDRTAKSVSSSFGGVTRTATMKDGEGCTGDALP